jgi:ribonuclease HI
MSQPQDDLKHVTIYTDGACFGNPGPGGYGVVLLYEQHRKELSSAFALTTNNRMEIMAAIAGLEALRNTCRVTLYSDSQYLVNAISKGWVQRWQANNWWRNSEELASNSDLWEKLLSLCSQHSVEFVWVKGHAGNPENERCDELSRLAVSKLDLPIDEGYAKQAGATTSGKKKITEEGQPCRKCATPVIKKIPRKGIGLHCVDRIHPRRTSRRRHA